MKMEIKRENLNSSRVQDVLVWAKMRYCPYWPARVVEPPPQIGRVAPNKRCVIFFGTKQFGIIEKDNIKDYVQNREQLVKKGRGAVFGEAIKRMDEFISDPNKYRSNASVKPLGLKIKVKTERHIEECLGIKKEIQSVSIKQRNPSHIKPPSYGQCAQHCAEEKKKLIDACKAMKTENQNLTFDLKKKCDECVKLIAEIENVKKELKMKSEDMKTFILDLDNTKSELADKERKYEQEISSLVHENKVLIAREKQFKKEFDQQIRKKEVENADECEQNADEDHANVYEVAKLLDDKMIGKVRFFLVRWKGFKAKDDTWEAESNLMCPSILKKYLQKKHSA